MVRRNISNQRFGRLLALSYAHTKNGKSFWNCVCDCGKSAVVHTYNMTSGTAKSCGCYADETRVFCNRKHGKYGTTEYNIWNTMISRCTKQKNEGYMNYGGRGISVCEKWKKFEGFFDDMGERPTKGHTLDRINNDGNYCKENCRWATAIEQANNRRNNVFVTMNNKTLTATQWANIFGINAKSLLGALSNGRTLQGFLEKKKIPYNQNII